MLKISCADDKNAILKQNIEKPILLKTEQVFKILFVNLLLYKTWLFTSKS